MDKEFVFCDQCIIDITNKRQLIGKETEMNDRSENIFCSRKCEIEYNCQEMLITNYYEYQNCNQCNNQFPLGQLKYYNHYGIHLCSVGCLFRFKRENQRYNCNYESDNPDDFAYKPPKPLKIDKKTKYAKLCNAKVFDLLTQ